MKKIKNFFKIYYLKFKNYFYGRDDTINDPLPGNQPIAQHPTVIKGMYIGLSVAFIIVLLELGELGLKSNYPDLTPVNILLTKLVVVTIILVGYGFSYQKWLSKKHLRETLEKRIK